MSGALIVNPYASKVDEEVVERVQRVLPAPLHTVSTHGPGHAQELAAELQGSVDAIYVLSGDGTYNEVLNGLDGRTPVGFLPGGGTSVLPRALGLPRDPERAAAVLARGRTRRIGLGSANGRRFGFNAGLGFDAALVRAVDEIGRPSDGRRPGDRAFARAALGLVAGRRARFEPELEVLGYGRAAFVLVANCRPYTYLGRIGLDVARGASFEGGVDLVAPRRLTPWSLPRFAWQAWRGAGGDGVIVVHDADRLVVRCDQPLPLQADGEDLGDADTVVFASHRAAVDVLC